MPSLLDLRRRIWAVKSTQQITKAMKAVAASRLRKAQEQMIGARPFADQMQRVLGSLAGQVDASAHRLLTKRGSDTPLRPSLLIIVSADKGLCGSFNTNVIKEAENIITQSDDQNVSLGLVGRKGRDYFGGRGFDVRFELVNIFSNLKYGHAQVIAREVIASFVEDEVDSVQLVYNKFKNVIQQEVVVDQVLPIKPISSAPNTDEKGPEYLYEPNQTTIFDSLIPHYVEIQFYRALLESAAAKHAAQLTAMEAASNNASEMIEDLTLDMNKVRQTKITGEIIEIVSGAEAI